MKDLDAMVEEEWTSRGIDCGVYHTKAELRAAFARVAWVTLDTALKIRDKQKIEEWKDELYRIVEDK